MLRTHHLGFFTVDLILETRTLQIEHAIDVLLPDGAKTISQIYHWNIFIFMVSRVWRLKFKEIKLESCSVNYPI